VPTHTEQFESIRGSVPLITAANVAGVWRSLEDVGLRQCRRMVRTETIVQLVKERSDCVIRQG
jgi:hypothetical protein